MAFVSTSTRIDGGPAIAVSSEYKVTKPVAGGMYSGGNADWRPTFAGANIRSMTGYHSLAEPGPAIFPGESWRSSAMATGIWYNLVVEAKIYGGSGAAKTQIFSVRGTDYSVPTPDGLIQRNPTIAAGAWPTAYSYDQLASGKCDGLLHRLHDALRKVPAGVRVNVQFASEVDTDNEHGVQSGSTVYPKALADERALAAWTHVLSWFKDPPTGTPKLPDTITFTLGWAGSWSGYDSFARLHPDTLPVDYLQWNVYNHSANKTPYERLSEMIAFYRRLGPIMRKKDIIIAEWGTAKKWTGGQAPYIRAWPAAVQKINVEQLLRGEGQIVMTNYFNSNDNTWGRLDPIADGAAAIVDAYNTPPFGWSPPRQV